MNNASLPSKFHFTKYHLEYNSPGAAKLVLKIERADFFLEISTYPS